jgi:hypothetical protein
MQPSTQILRSLVNGPAALAAAVLLLGPAPRARSQGCIATKNSPTCALMQGGFTNVVSSHQWLATLDYRWYESGRHFAGDVEQPQRQAQGTQVNNYVHSIDVAATYGFTPRWSITFDIPFIDADRSSLYEHGDGLRHSMHAGGLGDIRLVTDYWLLDPEKHMDGDVALGIGFKAPTGDDKASDISYRATGPVIRPVDPSIQPGDGGWGIILELEAYQKIYGNLYGYLNGSYMITPQEKNGTEFTLADRPGFPASIHYDTIADQYLGRGGFNYVVWPKGGLSVSLGARIEGIPVYDAIGGSMGFRRPGYTISIEPGVSWTYKKNSVSILSPVALYRNRERSAPEIADGRPGGDAAFADYSILAVYSRLF